MASFEGYQDITKLADGRDRVVFKAFRAIDQLPVVLKTLRSERPSPDAIALMYHEYEVCKDLDFPGIIRTYEMIHQQNQYALVQEDMHGISLQDYLAEHPLKDLSLFLKLAIQMTRILRHLHQCDIIHKDIKPSNFIIDPESLTEKLTDFNYSSKLLHEMQDIVPPERLEGTLAYMAPEQTGRMNMNIDYRSDFYALGVSFYEMLTGELPFIYEDPLELLHAHLANPVPEIVNPHMSVPPILGKIVQKLMAKNPTERYQSAVGLEADLERCQTSLETTGRIDSFTLGEYDVFDRLNLSEKLYGREEDAKLLLEFYDRVSKGAVEALMVCGYSGIGKTMLINEVHRPMVQHKGYYISGKFDLLQRNMPYTAITQAFNKLVRLILSEPEERFAKIKKDIIQALGGVAQVIIDLAPDLELIIGPQPPLEKLPPQETQSRMMVFFKRFLEVIANQDHPLVLFIDDLQWIDSGSLKLLEYILTDENLTHVLLIGAYRDNEVDNDHPLRQFFKTVETQGKSIHSLNLKPLTAQQFESLFKDSFNRSDAAVISFAELIHKRTEGNPFFAKQVVRTLYREKLLYFDYKKRRWDWNLEGITELKITENVVDLMLSKLLELPEDTQKLLKYAACIGNRFTINALMLITGQSADTLGKQLWPALHEELILTLRSGHKRMDAMQDANISALLSKDITYQFIHDRIQQAVYQGISEEEKQRAHLAIARLLVKNESDPAKAENLFEIVDHFNEADMLLEKDEKIEVAHLNYEASIRAKNANAYRPMRNYLKAALDLIGEAYWDIDYSFTFMVNRDYILSLYLLGKETKAEALIKALLARARTNFDKASLRRIQIMSYAGHGDIPQTIETARLALSLLGVKLAKKSSKMTLIPKLLLLQWRLRSFHVEKLDTELKTLTDPSKEAAFEILVETFFTFFSNSTESFVEMTIVAMDLQLTYGKPRSAGLWMTAYALVVLNAFKNITLTLQYRDVAERLLQELPDKYSSGMAFGWIGYLINHLRYPIKDSEPYLQRAAQDCRESGNTNQSNVILCINYFFATAEGQSIEKCAVAAAVSYKSSAKKGFKELSEHFQAFNQMYKNLVFRQADQEERLKILVNDLDRSQALLQKTRTKQYFSFYFYFTESFKQAIDYHFRWYPHEAILWFELFSYEIKATNALALAKLIPTSRGITRWLYQRRFRRITHELKWIAASAPENYLHHYLFLKGVQAKLEKKDDEALIFFNQAIGNAKKGDFYLWIALGNELAADLLTEKNQLRCAVDYIREAHYYYARYGMKLKVQSLEQRYPDCFAEKISNPKDVTGIHSSLSTSATTTTTSASLDFMSVIKASQTISGEIVLDKLFEKMLHIAVENVGAEKALFLEHRKNEWIVTASLEVQHDQEQFNMLGMTLKEFPDLPKTLIHYALRSREPVVLNHAAEDRKYSQDPYILRVQPKSILCLPVLRQDIVLGAIYLENNLTIGAFSQERVTVLTTLASQIAISLENARHFEVMEKLYRSTERFVPRGFLNLLKKETIEDIKVGDSIEVSLAPMFADIRNFTTISEALGTEKTAFILNSYMQKMTPIIRQHQGFVSQFTGDGIMALFPRRYVDALDAAIQMRAALSEFNEFLKAQGYDPIEIGIGVNAGSAMLITLGEEERMDTSVVSDVVNSAARIEGLNKLYGTGLLFSDVVYNAIKNPEDYLIRFVDNIKVKGKKQSMKIYEALTLLKTEDLPEVRAYINAYQQAFKYYEEGDFKTALNASAECVKTRPNDSVAIVLHKRCESFLASGVPSGWDGTYTALEK